MKWVCAFGSVCMMMCGGIAGSQAEEVVRLANGEWPPFTSEQLKHDGVYSHIVSEAFALEGVKVEYGFFPWKRSYIYTQEGDWDGSLTWARTPDKEQEVFFSDSVFHHTKVFFHLKDVPFDWNSIEDLKGFTIGVANEYTYGDEFDQAVKDGILTVESVPRDLQNIHKLLAGRFDIFPSDIDVVYELLQTNFSSEDIARVTHHPKPIQETGTCVIFTKVPPERSQHLLELFNSGLKKLKESGRYDQMLEASRRGEYSQK